MVKLNTLSGYPDADQPKRTIAYLLIWCSSGTIDIVVDEKKLTLQPHDVLTITSGQVHYFKNTTNAEGYILEFPLAFFCKDDNDIELIFHNGLFCHFDMNEVIPIKPYQIIEDQLKLIEAELQEQPYQHLISIHSRITLILVAINRAKVERGDEIWKPDALFLKFLEIARSSFEKNYTMKDYARILGTTEAKINEQSKLHTGKTAQNVVYELVISEAKRLLIYQKLSVKEVAYKLGFNDPFYFSNFFKKYTNASPKSYQSKNSL
ncbi:AraC family transcriptional regulator [Chitinophaga pendula]|uniref:helix-turn-helix domain-containing protein n=1 Tax=Chitinophaga TaxID=79328 RepID=UPI000BAF57FA|nr:MULTISPECIES: AraC family transcriptional regulator [Chitinophaga]ASZ10753.1 AraC family transcriptional regulator [Chitinophaga sp. MD30]UCJ06272.1 AraC family transcriptional regulator [Chitinophaga pendula]